MILLKWLYLLELTRSLNIFGAIFSLSLDLTLSCIHYGSIGQGQSIRTCRVTFLCKVLSNFLNNYSAFQKRILSERSKFTAKMYDRTFYSLLLNIRLPSFRANWVCQPRAFSHASGVYHLDGGFTILCRWSLMSYSGSETRVWPMQPT